MGQIRKGPTRRCLLKAATCAGLGLVEAPPFVRAAAAQSWPAGDPFSLGVASGASRPGWISCCGPDWRRSRCPIIRDTPGACAAVM